MPLEGCDGVRYQFPVAINDIRQLKICPAVLPASRRSFWLNIEQRSTINVFIETLDI